MDMDILTESEIFVSYYMNTNQLIDTLKKMRIEKKIQILDISGIFVGAEGAVEIANILKDGNFFL